MISTGTPYPDELPEPNTHLGRELIARTTGLLLHAGAKAVFRNVEAFGEEVLRFLGIEVLRGAWRGNFPPP
jgi:hypothetical protein